MSAFIVGISSDAVKYRSRASSTFFANAFDDNKLERRHDLPIRGGMKIYLCVFLVIWALRAYINASCHRENAPSLCDNGHRRGRINRSVHSPALIAAFHYNIAAYAVPHDVAPGIQASAQSVDNRNVKLHTRNSENE
jgi:hypothetical protein